MKNYIMGAIFFVAGLSLWIVGATFPTLLGVVLCILGVCVAFSRKSNNS